MIDALNTATAYLYGDTYPNLLRCRYREFVERQHYRVPSYNGMEYDEYDTPAAVYLVWKDADGNIRAGKRIHPTSRPYMIKDHWPNAVRCVPLPNSTYIWEASRFFIDRDLDQILRHQAHGEILCAMLELGLLYDITHYIAIAPPHLWDFTYRRYGWPAEIVGPITEIGFSEEVQACMMAVSETTLETIRTGWNIRQSVLSKNPELLMVELAFIKT